MDARKVDSDPEVVYVADPLPPCPPLTEDERAAILDNYRWFSKFSPYEKLKIAHDRRAVVRYFQELSRGIR